MGKIQILVMLSLLAGCVQTTVLRNGRTEAPTDSSVFKNRIYFEQSILTQLDTLVIYEEYDDNYYNEFGKQPNVLARLNYNNPNTTYGTYRFYGNGCYSYFALDRNDTTLTSEMFDPTYTGWRGVLYKKNDKILGDIFTQVGQMPWELGILTEELTFTGDTLIAKVKNKHRYKYIKRKIDSTLLEHTADW